MIGHVLREFDVPEPWGGPVSGPARYSDVSHTGNRRLFRSRTE